MHGSTHQSVHGLYGQNLCTKCRTVFCRQNLYESIPLVPLWNISYFDCGWFKLAKGAKPLCHDAIILGSFGHPKVISFRCNSPTGHSKIFQLWIHLPLERRGQHPAYFSFSKERENNLLQKTCKTDHGDKPKPVKRWTELSKRWSSKA